VRRYFEHSSHYLKYYSDASRETVKGATDLYLLDKLTYDEKKMVLILELGGDEPGDRFVLKLKADGDTEHAREKMQEWVDRVKMYQPDDDEEDAIKEGSEEEEEEEVEVVEDGDDPAKVGSGKGAQNDVNKDAKTGGEEGGEEDGEEDGKEGTAATHFKPYTVTLEEDKGKKVRGHFNRGSPTDFCRRPSHPRHVSPSCNPTSAYWLAPFVSLLYLFLFSSRLSLSLSRSLSLSLSLALAVAALPAGYADRNPARDSDQGIRARAQADKGGGRYGTPSRESRRAHR
jgi:hypothetical protein